MFMCDITTLALHGENASVKSQLAINIGKILTVAGIELPQIAEKPSALALSFSQHSEVSTVCEPALNTEGSEPSAS